MIPKKLLFLLLMLVGIGYSTIYYWVEHDNVSTPLSYGKIWTKLNVSSPSQTFYIYYGGSTDKSNGDAVFEFFDDFDGTSLDTSKWQIFGSSYLTSSRYHISDSKFTAYFWSGDNSITPSLSSVNQYNYDLEVGMYIKLNVGSYFETGPIIDISEDTSLTTSQFNSFVWSDYNDEYRIWGDLGSTRNFPSSYTYAVGSFGRNDYHLFRLSRIDKTFSGSDDTTSISFSVTDTSLNKYGYIGIANGWAFNYENVSVDWFYMRKISNVSISITYGSEETGSWIKDGETYTKRKLITISPSSTLTDYTIGLDYSQFNDNKLFIEEASLTSIDLLYPNNSSSYTNISIFKWNVSGFSTNYDCNITIDNVTFNAGSNSLNYFAPSIANKIGKHYWNVSCNDSLYSDVSDTWFYTILNKSINLTYPINNTLYKNISIYNWTLTNFVGAFNCNLTVDNNTFTVPENQTTYNANNSIMTSNGIHYWNVSCNDLYDGAVSMTNNYEIDNQTPSITSITLEYINISPEHFRIKCYLTEPNVYYVEINLTSNDSLNHSGSVNATGNYNASAGYYYADFFWTEEQNVVYNYSCYVIDKVNLSDYLAGQYSTVNASPSSGGDEWENYTFSNVNVSITEPKQHDTIPFKQYYLTFDIQHTFSNPRTATCKFYISYDLGYTKKYKIFSKQYTLTNQTTTIREPINTEVSFLDYVGNYQRDAPSQQKVYVICGLDNFYAGYSDTTYYVNFPSSLSILLLLMAILSIIVLLWATIYTDKGVIYGYIAMALFLFSVISLSVDGVAGSWYFKEFIEIGFYLINILFLIAYAELAFEPKEEMKEGL